MCKMQMQLSEAQPSFVSNAQQSELIFPPSLPGNGLSKSSALQINIPTTKQSLPSQQAFRLSMLTPVAKHQADTPSVLAIRAACALQTAFANICETPQTLLDSSVFLIHTLVPFSDISRKFYPLLSNYWRKRFSWLKQPVQKTKAKDNEVLVR